jgi:Domain of unknown function (DUF4372)
MYIGKTLFAQIMDFIPWTSFGRIVARYRGNARVTLAAMHRAVSRNGFCANDLARKPSRHRSLFVCTIS